MKNIWPLVIAVLVTMVMSVYSGILGYFHGKGEIQRAAVKIGVAKWVVKDQDNPTMVFEWTQYHCPEKTLLEAQNASR